MVETAELWDFEPTMVHGFVSLALASPVATEATDRGLAALKAALYA